MKIDNKLCSDILKWDCFSPPQKTKTGLDWDNLFRKNKICFYKVVCAREPQYFLYLKVPSLKDNKFCNFKIFEHRGCLIIT